MIVQVLTPRPRSGRGPRDQTGGYSYPFGGDLRSLTGGWTVERSSREGRFGDGDTRPVGYVGRSGKTRGKYEGSGRSDPEHGGESTGRRTPQRVGSRLVAEWRRLRSSWTRKDSVQTQWAQGSRTTPSRTESRSRPRGPSDSPRSRVSGVLLFPPSPASPQIRHPAPSPPPLGAPPSDP